MWLGTGRVGIGPGDGGSKVSTGFAFSRGEGWGAKFAYRVDDPAKGLSGSVLIIGVKGSVQIGDAVDHAVTKLDLNLLTRDL